MIKQGDRNLAQSEIKSRLKSVEDKLDMQNNDIHDIYIILKNLEDKTDLSEEERKLAAKTLNQVIAWAQQVAEKMDIPLNITN